MAKKRHTETKDKIKEVFTVLLKEKGFDLLTVSDIAREANINRGTFYLHYMDKYDLLEKLENEVIEDLTLILLKDEEAGLNVDDPLELIPYQSIVKALYYVKNDFSFIDALINNGGDSYFIQKMKNILEELIKNRVNQSAKLEFSMKDLPADYALEILLSAVTSIIILWIKKGSIETPEEIAFMISQAKEISPYELLI